MSLIEEIAVEREKLRADARRYQRLRILGCAVDGTRHLEAGLVIRFQCLDDLLDEDIRRHPSRGEAHEVLSAQPADPGLGPQVRPVEKFPGLREVVAAHFFPSKPADQEGEKK